MISIQPKSCLRGTATKFDVINVVYAANGTATANALLKESDGTLVDSLVASASAAQTAAWSDDDTFFKTLATNAGLTPA